MNGPTAVPFVDLAAQHQEVRYELERAFARLIESSAFVGGPFVEAFESEFAAYLGVRHVVGVSSGTDAVRIALESVGVEPGDAVVTVAHTFIGTTEGIEHIGAHPLFIDVDPGSRTMGVRALAEFLERECARDADGAVRHRVSGRRIGAVLPVHLYGQSADMEPILDIGTAYGIPVVEDAAQAQGARYRFADGREALCGAMGDAAAFSFYPGKNLGAMGEAGAVATNDVQRAERARLLREHGQSEKYVHQVAHAGNARLDAFQAAVLGIKLRRLDGWNSGRRAAAAAYGELLRHDAAVSVPHEMPYAHHVYHLYVIQVADRDRVRAELDEAGVATGLHYPIPLHRQPAYRGRDVIAGPLPETERAAATCLSLPVYPHIRPDQIERVVSALRRSLRPEPVGLEA